MAIANEAITQGIPTRTVRDDPSLADAHLDRPCLIARIHAISGRGSRLPRDYVGGIRDRVLADRDSMECPMNKQRSFRASVVESLEERAVPSHVGLRVLGIGGRTPSVQAQDA